MVGGRKTIIVILLLFIMVSVFRLGDVLRSKTKLEKIKIHVPYISNVYFRKKLKLKDFVYPKDVIEKVGYTRFNQYFLYKDKPIFSIVSHVNQAVIDAIKSKKFDKSKMYISVLTPDVKNVWKIRENLKPVPIYNILPFDINREAFLYALSKKGLLVSERSYADLEIYNYDVGIVTVENEDVGKILSKKGLPFAPLIKFSSNDVYDEKYSGEKWWNKKVVSSVYDDANSAYEQARSLEQFVTKYPFSEQVKKAADKLKDFQSGKVKSSEVFDAKKMARLIAYSQIWGFYDFVKPNNLKFYYNIYTQKLEPVVFYNSIANFDGFAKRENVNFYNPFSIDFVEKILSDKQTHGFYEKYLSSYYKDEFLSEKINDISQKAGYLKELAKPYGYYFSQDEFVENLKQSALAFEKKQAVDLAGNVEKTDDKKSVSKVLKTYPYLKYDAKNRLFVIDEKTLVINKNLVIPKGYGLKIKSGVRIGFAKNVGILSYGAVFIGDENGKPVVFEPKDNAKSGLEKNVKLFSKGLDVLLEPNVISRKYRKAVDSIPYDDFFEKTKKQDKYAVVRKLNPFVGRNAFEKDFDFRGYVKDENLIDGYVKQKKNRQAVKALISLNDASFLRTKTWQKLYPYYENAWNGICVINAKKPSIIVNAKILGAKGHEFAKRAPRSAITFYNSDAKIKNVSVKKAYSDSAIKFYGGTFTVSNVDISGVLGDGFLAQSAKGSVEKIKVKYVSDNALSFLNSDVVLGDIQAKLYGDVGIQADEKSKVELENALLEGGFVGVSASNGANVVFKNVVFEKNRFAKALLIDNDYSYVEEFAGMRSIYNWERSSITSLDENKGEFSIIKDVYELH